VGRIVGVGARAGRSVGERVFVPGARCFGPVRGLFGGAAQTLVVRGARVVPLADSLAEEGVLLALAATAYHALAAPGAHPPELIVGHGVLGRLLARITVALGGQPVVWETNSARREGASGYACIHPDADSRRDYKAICDVSGDPRLLDTLIGRLAMGGEIVLAGFYSEPLSFSFPAAFMREARLRIAAEWKEPDVIAVTDLLASGRLELGGLITHRAAASAAESAYRTAFTDPDCLKMVLDWRSCP
jgi:3-hydroxyethyl bacteriochlorophyllide a dehydrogenase